MGGAAGWTIRAAVGTVFHGSRRCSKQRRRSLGARPGCDLRLDGKPQDNVGKMGGFRDGQRAVQRPFWHPACQPASDAKDDKARPTRPCLSPAALHLRSVIIATVLLAATAIFKPRG